MNLGGVGFHHFTRYAVTKRPFGHHGVKLDIVILANGVFVLAGDADIPLVETLVLAALYGAWNAGNPLVRVVLKARQRHGPSWSLVASFQPPFLVAHQAKERKALRLDQARAWAALLL